MEQTMRDFSEQMNRMALMLNQAIGQQEREVVRNAEEDVNDGDGHAHLVAQTIGLFTQ